MKKTKSISDLVTDLQQENDELRFLRKLFEKACVTAFGYDIKTIKIMLEKQRAYEAKRTERQAQKERTNVAYSQSGNGSDMGERKANPVLDLDTTDAGLSDGGHSPISI